MPIATITVTPNSTNVLNISSTALQGTWVVGTDNLSHVKNIRSEITKHISTLKIGTHYRIKYEVYDLVSCSVQLRMGGNKYGESHSTAGVFTEYFTVESEIDKNLSFISDGVLKVRNISFEEKVFNTNLIPFTDTEKFENKSWTKSFSFHSGSWISYHNYLPNYYVHTQNSIYSTTVGDNKIWRHNQVGNFQTFYGKYHPFILEYVALSNPLQSKVLEDLTFHTKARRWDTVRQQYLDMPFITFNKIVIYNSRQSSGEMEMIIKDTQANPENWLGQQTVNKLGSMPVTRKERNWNINELRDNIIDYDQPLFTSGWNDLKFEYFIDKVQNSSALSFTKPWHELQNFRDKYVVIRLKFDTFNNVNLLLNYSLETESPSIR